MIFLLRINSETLKLRIIIKFSNRWGESEVIGRLNSRLKMRKEHSVFDFLDEMYYNLYYNKWRRCIMTSIRLDKDTERKLEKIAASKKITKSQLIREAIAEYITASEKYFSPYKVGEPLFGKYGSGKDDISATYKSRIKDKINAKNTR